MRFTYTYLLFFLLLKCANLSAQDNLEVLTESKLLWFIDNYHPVAKQGELLRNKGESTVTKARGNFDPYLNTDLNQKYFEDKNYYSLLNGGLKVPTWYGIELKTGYEQNSGVFLNPENNLPQNGLLYAGISVPIGQGLFIDQRRATLKQAKIFAKSTEAERRKLMNDLYFEALQKYWYWVEAWNQYLVNEESVELAQTRFDGVKTSFKFGDLPAIDTLEAYIQVQNRQINRNNSQISYQIASLELSNYLWYENYTPLEITDSLKPPNYKLIELNNVDSSKTLQDILFQLPENHPDMQLISYKLSSIEIEKRLKAEQLKPKLNINYNALNEPVGNDFTENYSVQNYKWGLNFSYPIFTRKQRGDLQLTRLKIQETKLGQNQKLLELQNKVKSYYFEQLNLQKQVSLFSSTVNNYNKLLEGEKQKFNSGESSLFLINSREINLIHAKLKLIELMAKYKIAHNGLKWSAGELF